MPFREELAPMYHELIRPTLQDVGYEVRRADDLGSQRNIMRDIIEEIERASLIIADLTGRNPNVMYELGIAHAFKKAALIVTQDLDDVPFDLRGYRAIKYSTIGDSLDDFRSQISELGASHLRGEMLFGSPVTDFATQAQVEPANDDRIKSAQQAAKTAGRALTEAMADLMGLDQQLQENIETYERASARGEEHAERELFVQLGKNDGQRRARLGDYRKQATTYYASIGDLVTAMDLKREENVRGLHALRASLQETLGISAGFADALRIRRDQLLDLGQGDEALRREVSRLRSSYDDVLAADAVNDATIERLTSLIDARLGTVA
jgi:hypothetical protein